MLVRAVGRTHAAGDLCHRSSRQLGRLPARRYQHPRGPDHSSHLMRRSHGQEPTKEQIHPHAEADDPYLACAGRLSAQPLTRRVDVCKGVASIGSQITQGGSQAGRSVSPGIEIRGNGKVASARQPVRLFVQVGAIAQGIVDHDNTGPGSFARWLGQIATKLMLWVVMVTSVISPSR